MIRRIRIRRSPSPLLIEAWIGIDLFKLIDTDATDFAKRAGFYQDEAIRNPVVISKNGRPKTVLVAYDEFIRLRERDRRSFTVDDIHGR